WLRRLNFAEVHRVDVVHRQSEIRVIPDVEKFRAELQILRFREAEVLDRREIPLLESRTLHDVSSGVTELPGIGGGIKPLERRRRNPLIRCARSSVRIAHEIGAIAGEAGDFRSSALRGYSCGIVNGERRSAHERGDAVRLPTSENARVPGLFSPEERKIPLIADHEAVARVE